MWHVIHSWFQDRCVSIAAYLSTSTSASSKRKKILLYILSFKTSFWVTVKRNKKDFTPPKPCTQATLANIVTRSAKPGRREYFVTTMSKGDNAIKKLPEWEITRQYSLIKQRDGNEGCETVLRVGTSVKNHWAIACLHWRRKFFYCVLFMFEGEAREKGNTKLVPSTPSSRTSK